MTTLADIVMQNSAQQQQNYKSTLATVIGTAQWAADYQFKQKQFEADQEYKKTSKKFMETQTETMDLQNQQKKQALEDQRIGKEVLSEFSGKNPTPGDVRNALYARGASPNYVQQTTAGIQDTQMKQLRAQEQAINTERRMSQLIGEQAAGALTAANGDPMKARDAWNREVAYLQDKGFNVPNIPEDADIIAELQGLKASATSLNVLANQKASVLSKSSSAYNVRLLQEKQEYEKLPAGKQRDELLAGVNQAIAAYDTQQFNEKFQKEQLAEQRRLKISEKEKETFLPRTLEYLGVPEGAKIGNPEIEMEAIKYVSELDRQNVPQDEIKEKLRERFQPSSTPWGRGNGIWQTVTNFMDDLGDNIPVGTPDWVWYKDTSATNKGTIKRPSTSAFPKRGTKVQGPGGKIGYTDGKGGVIPEEEWNP